MSSAMPATAKEGKSDSGGQQMGRNVIDCVKTDHAAVNSLFDAYKKSTGSSTDKQIILWKIIRELSIHSAVEEELMYPVLKEKCGAEGKKWYDSSLAEHLDLKKALYELDLIDADPKDAKTAGLVSRIEKLVMEHVNEEEKDVLPFLSKCVDTNYLRELGKNFVSYKPYMPTRPHPSAPPGSKLGDRALAAADYLRDAKRFQGVPDYVIQDPNKLPAMSSS